MQNSMINLTLFLRILCIVPLVFLTACVSNSGNGNASLGNDTVAASGVPTITGTPASAAFENSRYVFQPSANDRDGDVLEFRIKNLPSWAKFDPATGKLSGKPGVEHDGVYGNIQISVTDGVNTVSLPAFTITVTTKNQQLGEISLSWTAPVARADGKPLSLGEIAGYTIKYGKQPGNYTHSLDISGAANTSVTISDLPVGDYFVVLVTRDTNGLQSQPSNMITKKAL